MTFKLGVSDGEAKSWHENGKIKAMGKLVDGKREGPWQCWKEDGARDDEQSGVYHADEKTGALKPTDAGATGDGPR